MTTTADHPPDAPLDESRSRRGLLRTAGIGGTAGTAAMVLAAAGSVARVEARQPTAIRRTPKDQPAPRPFGVAGTKAAVVKAITPLIAL